jgi:flagellar basal-body rod modification protein FlgD
MIAGSAAVQAGAGASGIGATVSAPGEKNRATEGPATEPKFGEVLSNIQAQYGGRPEKQRAAKKTLDKDDFLKIMITQMKHQDPTSPFKAEQMATEMAQFTSVEQMQNINQTLNRMANQNSPLERMAMTNLIGKTVTVDRERFPHVEGQGDSLSYALPRNAASVKLVVADDKGEAITERDLGAVEAGDHTYAWDGLRTGGLPVKSGNLMFKVIATDARGASIPIQSQSRAQVVGVSFEGSEPALLIGDPTRPQKVGLKGLIRVDSDPGAAVIPGAKPLASMVAPTAPVAQTATAQAGGAPSPAAPAAMPAVAGTAGNFFTFQKGEGSSTMDSARLTPEVRAALSQYEKQRAEFEAEKSAKTGEAFPNGLGGGDEEKSAPAAQNSQLGG